MIRKDIDDNLELVFVQTKGYEGWANVTNKKTKECYGTIPPRIVRLITLGLKYEVSKNTKRG